MAKLGSYCNRVKLFVNKAFEEASFTNLYVLGIVFEHQYFDCMLSIWSKM
jgi:hypothetical protein